MRDLSSRDPHRRRLRLGAVAALLLVGFPPTVVADPFAFGGGDGLNPCTAGEPRPLVPENDVTRAVLSGGVNGPGVPECDPAPVVDAAIALGTHAAKEAEATSTTLQDIAAQNVERARAAAQPFTDAIPDPEDADEPPAEPPIGAPCTEASSCPVDPAPDACDSAAALIVCHEPDTPCDDRDCVDPCRDDPCAAPCDGASVLLACLEPEPPCEGACPLPSAPTPPCLETECCATAAGASICEGERETCEGDGCACPALAGAFCGTPIPWALPCVTATCPILTEGCIVLATCALYAPDGNANCSPFEFLLGVDTDTDGEKDCSDNDDDNDGISDEVEMRVIGNAAARTTLDSDGDGIFDAVDLIPNSAAGVTIHVSIGHYDGNGETCDLHEPFIKRSDPYLQSWALNQVPLGAADLLIPPGWSYEAHVEEREAGPVSDGSAPPVTVSADLNDWAGLNPWEIPKIGIAPLFYDHDTAYRHFDEPVDISMTSGHGTDGLEHSLDIDDVNSVLQFKGNEPCRAKLHIIIVDGVAGNVARMTVANRMLEKPVEMDDILYGPFV